MLCTVYRSNKKSGVYVYLAKDTVWDDLPEELVASLGDCVVVMHLDLNKRDKLASEDIAVVRESLQSQGYHLQLPPKMHTQVINYG